jgi:hypothetical protein
MPQPLGDRRRFDAEIDEHLARPQSEKSSVARCDRNNGQEVLVNAQRAPGVSFGQVVPSPAKLADVSLRLDSQVSPNNSLTVRYRRSIALAGGAFSPSNQAANRTAGWGVRFEF